MSPVGPRNKLDVNALQRRIRVALAREPADLVLHGGRVVNVFTQRIESANVAIADGWIAAVGPYDWPATERISIPGQVILPGLIDAHIHLESTLLMPAELARLIVPRGTTAVVADPHEIANVAGIAGVEMMAQASADLPLDVILMAPSCVPASPHESPGAILNAESIAHLLAHPDVLGLAEMMNFPGVLDADADVLAKLVSALNMGVPVDGHAPGLRGKPLIAYASTGIRSDHESTTVEEAEAKASLGMLVQVREGSAARNLDGILPALADGRLGDRWCLATDDIHVDDLMDHGHLDSLLRRLVAGGVPAAQAVRHVSWIPAQHYGLNDRGAVAPGYRADLLVVEDLSEFKPALVVKDGQVVARDGRYEGPRAQPIPQPENSIRFGKLDASAFEFRTASATCPVIGIVPDQIVTRKESRAVRLDGTTGRWVFDSGRDVVLAACVERHKATGRVGLGFVNGLGIRRSGALGSSVAHDAHNLIIAGTTPRDMLGCAQALQECGGGFVVVANGEVLARLPLPVGGLMSTNDCASVRRQLDEVNEAARSLGSPLAAPFGTISFLCLSVIPELRLTDRGLYDVAAQRFMEGNA